MEYLLNFYKCLAEQTRLQCLLLLQSEGELCVCELMAGLQLSQPKISRHLAELRKQGLVQDSRRGKWVYYRLHPQLCAWQQQIIATSLAQNPAAIADELQRYRQFCNNAASGGCC